MSELLWILAILFVAVMFFLLCDVFGGWPWR